MTVLLVLFTLILFLIFDHFVQRHRVRSAEAVAEPAEPVLKSFTGFPEDVSLATNHTWLRNNPDGTATIGLDEFLSRLIGVVEKISLPRPGERVVPAVAGIGLSSRGRGLKVTTPLSGDVIEANPDVLRDPSLLLRDPYGEGWLMRVRPRVESAREAEYFLVTRPGEWLHEQLGRLRDFLAMNSQQSPALVLQEGGLPAEGVLQEFDERVWKDFGRAFAALRNVKDAHLEEIRS